MAQLGARFHGMEEVKGSNPFRSTKQTQPRLTVRRSCSSRKSPAARQIVSNLTRVLVQAAQPKRIILFGSQPEAMYDHAARLRSYELIADAVRPGEPSREVA